VARLKINYTWMKLKVGRAKTPPVRLCPQYGNNRIKGLILAAGGDILLGQDCPKPFQLMFTWQMQRQCFEEVAVSPEPGTLGPLFCEGKLLPSNNVPKSPHPFIRCRLAIVIYKQPVVYSY
jgi:hypothetical protein